MIATLDFSSYMFPLGQRGKHQRDAADNNAFLKNS